MDIPETPDRAGRFRSVKRLKSKKRNGEEYQRFEPVDAEIYEFNGLTESERAARYKRARPETVMHFAREEGVLHEAPARRVIQEAARRICNAVRRRTAGQPKNVVEEIMLKVEMDIMGLLLSGAEGRAADFLEVDFYGAVGGRVLDALRSHELSAMGGKRDWIQTDEVDEDGDTIERTIELVPSDDPGAEAALLEAQDKDLVRRALHLARTEVDPRQLEAVILHYFEDWPVKSKDPDVASLEAYFGVPAWVVRHGISKTLKVLSRIITALKAGEVQ